MNQVLQQMAVDGGTIGDISQYFGTDQEVGDAISSYYKVAKNCGMVTGDECFAKFDDYYDGSANTTNTWDSSVSSNYKFTSVDGVSFAIASWNGNCITNQGISDAPNAPTLRTCGGVYIDVNGSKKPNYYGRDVFKFLITSNKTPMLYPAGGFYVTTSNTGSLTDGGSGYWNYQGTANKCSSDYKNGLYCTGRLMDKGWEMDY